MGSKAKTDVELWRALAGLDDDLLDANLPDAVVDAELEALEIDPQLLKKRGMMFVAKLREQHCLSWQVIAKQRQVEMEQRVSHVQVSPQLDRASVLARLDQLRATDERLGTAIKMAARKRKPEESTDEELRELLQEMEALRALEGDNDE